MASIMVAYRLYKPISDWLKNVIPQNHQAENVKSICLLDINEMKRNDLWLNVKGKYIFLLKNNFEYPDDPPFFPVLMIYKSNL